MRAVRSAGGMRKLCRFREPSHSRGGLTLLEVLLATAIFLGALTAIMQVMRVGHDSRISAKLDAEAALRCESVMGELVSGIRPLNSVSGQAFEDDDAWQMTIGVEDGGATSLLLLAVRVDHMANGDQPNSSFQLVRLLRDPQLFIDAAAAAADAETAE